MKGVSISINTIIILIVAVLVLVVITVLFIGSGSPGIGVMTHQDAWSRGCAILKERGCKSADVAVITVPNYNAKSTILSIPDNTIAVACENALYTTETDHTTLVNYCCEKCCGECT